MDEPTGPRRAASAAGRAMYDDEPETLSAREKYRRVAEHRRYPKKSRYNLEDLALGLTASDAGVNRYYAMHAGRAAKKALHYLAQAAGAKKPEVKSKSLRLARKHLANISAERHPELTEQIESRLLWEEGHRPETDDAKPTVNPNTGAQEFYGSKTLGAKDNSVSARTSQNTLKPKPTLKNESERHESILADTPSTFYVKNNPEAEGKAPWYSIETAGERAVLKHNDIIQQEAERAGIDADLLRSIIYVENAHGRSYGEPAEALGLSSTILPSNINVEKWKGLGIDSSNASNPKQNIGAAATLLSRIQARTHDPNIAKIATLYNGLMKDAVTDYGARTESVFKNKPWTNPHVSKRQIKYNR